MKILISDSIEQSCVDILREEGFEVDVHTGLKPDELKTIIGDYTGLLVRSSTKVTADVIAAMSNMKVIGRAGAGVDNIDVDSATRKGVLVMNTPGGNTISTAEHTISMMLALARNIPQANQDLCAGKWERKKYMGTELFEKTIGVIGLGKVGREVALRCKAFGMTVIGYDPLLSNEVADKLGIELTSLEEIYRRSDFITVHTPLNEETRGMIAEKQLAACKKGVRIINCARGGIVDEQALLKGLESGHVAGAALDVFVKEPPGDHLLLEHPKVIATPHLGASTEEAQEKVAIQIAHQVVDALKGRAIAGAVNAEFIQLAMRDEIKPYLTLVEKMGNLQAQLMTGKLRSITATYCGESLHQSMEILSAGILKGVLSNLMSEPVNYINAPIIAKEMGIVLNEKRDRDSENYTHLITVAFETDRESRSFSGTVFGNKDVRIVAIDHFHFEIKPEGYMLFYSNIDRPGMLASVSSILGRAKINIAGLSLGRYEIGKKALTVVSLDSDIPEPVLREITNIEGVYEAKVVKL